MPLKNSKKSGGLSALELFAGTGGLALGVHGAGFEHLGLIERDKFGVETLRDNSRKVLGINPDLILHADANSIDYRTFANKVDLLSAGPPCQPFSTAGCNRGYDDPRNMFPVLLDAVATIMPQAVLIENVKGLLRSKFRDAFDYILKRVQFPLHQMRDGETWRDHYLRLSRVVEKDFQDNEQYEVSYQLVDTADYGIPQRRERVIVVAFRRDLGLKTFRLEPTHSKEALLLDQYITGDYWKRHHIRGTPPRDHLGGNDEALLERMRKNLSLLDLLDVNRSPWVTVRDALSDLPKPVHRGSKEIFPNHIQHPGARVYQNHIGSFWDYPAKALKAGTHGTPGGENMLRFSPAEKDVRYFTTREAARLHSFPDSWIFHGTWGACIRQLGNAVPVKLSKIFATEIHSRLSATSQATVIKEKHEQKKRGRHHSSPTNPTSLRRD